MCGKLTNVRKDTHIDFRDHYILGSGQMCYSCYSKYYNPEDQLDVKSIEKLITMCRRPPEK